MRNLIVIVTFFVALCEPTAHAATLTVGFAGSGAGSVNSDLGLACTSSCVRTVQDGTAVVLIATPDANSTFTGWSGSGCSGTKTCAISADSNSAVVATFEAPLPIRDSATPSTFYRLLSQAVAAAPDGASVRVKSRSISLVERLNLERGVRLTVDGGYDRAFGGIDGSTVLHGAITVRAGKLVASRMKIGPAPPINSVVLFGDSNTEQSSLPCAERWSTLLSQSYATQSFVNEGKGGQTSSQALTDLEEKLLEHGPDLALVMFGTNDSIRYDYDRVSVPLELFEANIRKMIETIREVGALPVLMTCIPTVEGTGSDGYYYSRHPAQYYQAVGGANTWIQQYNAVVRKVGAESGVLVVDIWDRFRQAAGSIADADLLASGLLDRSGTHLTAAGSRLIHQALLVLQVAGAPN